MWLRRVALVSLVLSLPLRGETPWSVARDGNIEVYSHHGPEDAAATLQWLEKLRAIVQTRLGLEIPGDRPLTVFGFQSRAEYEPYRVRALSDAYYVGTAGRDYIVLPMLGPKSLATAAHEFAHLVSHSAVTQLPPWLSEGLAEVFSTIRSTRTGAQLGGEPAGRLLVLRNRRWLPLPMLLSLPAESSLRNTRAGSDIFYAQSWALTEMLLVSPQYKPHFLSLVAALAKDPASSADRLVGIYGTPLTAIAHDLDAWVRHHKSRPMVFEAALPPESRGIERVQISDAAVEARLATMLLATGNLEGAESTYRHAAAQAPEDPAVLAGRAAVALNQGRRDESYRLFAQALAGGLADATLAYQYAVLLDRMGGPVEQRRAALSRAIALQPAFDDARYALALLEKNLGNDAAALAQLNAMRKVAPARAYHYWLTMADALIGVGRGEEAVAAARKAAELASDPEEHAHAALLAHSAQTHLAVRFARDESGGLRLVTTRAPNDGTDWNPFIEPTDDIRRVDGRLVEIICSDPPLRLVVETEAGRIVVAVPDPAHVQMRNAPEELVCGPQAPAAVAIQYAAASGSGTDGTARRIEFR